MISRIEITVDELFFDTLSDMEALQRQERDVHVNETLVDDGAMLEPALLIESSVGNQVFQVDIL